MPADPTEMALQALPGHLIRRLQQIAVGLFLEETAVHELTPVQFAALSAVHAAPGIDQRTLARRIGFDTSTIGGVIDRLERRGLMQRQISPTDRRVRLLCVTESGKKLLGDVQPLMLRAQERILGPLTPADREHFMRMLQHLVDGNAGAARAPGPED
jgi:MarR family transcriptional regulator, lower aerobic nicotinate degradation pathway regulator